MAGSGADVKALQLQISASTELLVRNLKSADAAVSQFRQQTDRNLEQVEGRFYKVGQSIGSSLRTALTSATALIGGLSFFALAKQGLEYASSLGEVAQQLGVTSDQLQTFRFAATQVGISQEEMDKGLSKLTLSIGQAADGSQKQASAFNDLGINVRTVSGSIRTAGDIIPQLADALQKVTDPAARARIEVELFGKTGQQLDTLLSGGRAAIDGLTEAARQAGVVISPELIQRADDAADKLAAVKTILEAKIAGAVAENSGAILQFAESLTTLVGKIGPAINALTRFKLQLAITQDSIAQYTLGRPEARQAAAARLAAEREQLEVIDNPAGHLKPATFSGGAAFSKFYGARAGNLNPASGLNAISGSGGSKRSSGSSGASAARQAAAEALRREIEQIKADAAAGVSDTIKNAGSIVDHNLSDLAPTIRQANEVRDTLAEAQNNFYRIGQERINDLASTFEQAFSGAGGSFWKQFQSIGLGIVAQIAARLLTNNGGQGGGLGSIFKAAVGSGVGGSGLGGIFSSIGGLFGGKRAAGGPISAGVPYLVGERGPELVVPRLNGTVIPNGGFGMSGHTINVTVNAPGALQPEQIAEMTARQIAQAAPRIAAGSALLAGQQAGRARRRAL